MKRKKVRKIPLLIIVAFLLYGGFSLSSIHGRINRAQEHLYDVRQQVIEQELANAQLEYAIKNYNDPEFIADIARSHLGLVLPGEIIFYNVNNLD
jgi:cell division protein FtsB